MNLNINIHSEVAVALKAGQPVVALESTLITHGFPRPDNLRVAQAIEQTVRDQGAVPATIAILSGKIHVGLTTAQLNQLAEAYDVRKCSTRDLPIVVAQQGHGATTVAATMVIARLAGIRIFVTGGIGGVHRGDDHDISTDLIELGRIPITVVCGGMKAFLDLPRTLEFLETQAVPVLGYKTDEMPAFYSRLSGLPVVERVDTPQVVADMIEARDQLQLSNAILLTVPVPEADEWPAEQAGAVITQALIEAEQNNITGKSISPFLLSRIAILSGERSKRANESLLLNNARVGAQVAVALCKKPQPVYV